MLIVCPHCDFNKEVPSSAIPPGHDQVSCPKCGGLFALPVSDSIVLSSEASDPSYGESAAESPSNFAGFWIRGAAMFIDGLAVTLIQVIAAFLIGLILLRGGMNEQSMMTMQILVQLFSLSLSLVYYVFFTGYCGQTPGKMAMRIKVVSASGGEISYGTAFLRETLAKFVSAIILGIGYLMAAFDERKQGLHDKIAKTVVVRI